MGIDIALLDRYLAGECTPAEHAAITQWLEESPEAAEVLAALRRAGDAPASAAWNVDGAWLGSRHRLVHRAARSWPRVQVRGVMAAVAAALVVAVGFLAIQRRVPIFDGSRELTTAPGERATMTLRDGTQLVIGPATRLRIPADFGTKARVIDLDGEAYFAVVHDTSRPFAVRTGRSVIRDVGTKFVVQAYKADPDERIAVAEGEVALGDVMIGARGLGVINNGHVQVRRDIDLTRDLAWMQGELAFDGTPFLAVLRQLERTFDIEITVADSSLESEAITATFGDESADLVLDAVTRIVGAQYEREGRRVVIRRRTAASFRSPSMAFPPMHTAQARP